MSGFPGSSHPSVVHLAQMNRPKFSADYFRAQQRTNPLGPEIQQEEAQRGLQPSRNVEAAFDRDDIALSPVQKAPSLPSKATPREKKRVAHDVSFPPVEDDVEVERPTKRIKLEHKELEIESIESQPSLNDSFDNDSILKKFKGTPQKRLHNSSQSLSGSQRKDEGHPAPVPVKTPASRPSLSSLLNESAKKMPPIYQSIAKKAARARETPLRAPLGRPGFDEEIVAPWIAARNSNLSPVPIRNPNIRFLEEDSPMKPAPAAQARSPPRRQDSNSQEGDEDAETSMKVEEDDIEIEDVLVDISFNQDLEGTRNHVEPVDEFSEAEFVGKSFDSIDAGDVSRGDLGDVVLPSIFEADQICASFFALLNFPCKYLSQSLPIPGADEEEVEEEEEIKHSPVNSPPSSPYREPQVRPGRKRKAEDPLVSFPDPSHNNEIDNEPSTLRDYWMSTYKSNPFHLTPKELASQNPSTFVEKLSVESGKVTQGLGDLADYIPMGSLAKGGLAMSALKIIEASKRRLPATEIIEGDGDGPWFIVEIVGDRFGFRLARCVHCENPDLFCDLVFKPRKSLDWESPLKAKGAIKGPISSQSLFALLAVGTAFKPLAPFEYIAPPPPSTPPNNLSDNEEEHIPEPKLRPALLLSNFETVILPPPIFRLDLRASRSFLSHTPIFPMDSALPAPSLFAHLSFHNFQTFASSTNRSIDLDRFKQQRRFSVSIPNLSPSDLLGRPQKLVSFRGTVLKMLQPLEAEAPVVDATASFIDQALAKKFQSLSLIGDVSSQRQNVRLFVQLWAHPKTVVQIAVPLHNLSLLETLEECEGQSFEFHGLRKIAALDRHSVLPSHSDALDAKIAANSRDPNEFPDAMDIDTPTALSRLSAPPSHNRISLRFAFTSSSTLKALDSLIDSEALASSTPFESIHSHLKEVYVAGLVGREVSHGGVRVHLKGRLLRLSLVPHSSLRFTEFAILHLVDDQNLSVSFCVPHALFDAAKLTDLRSLHAQLLPKNRSMMIDFANLLIDGNRILFDSLSSIESYGDGSSTALSTDFMKSIAFELPEIEKLAPSLRYFTIATLPELRVVHFRNKSVTNSSRKFHQPIVFKCDLGLLAAPVKVNNRLKRLFPTVGAFSFRSVNRGLLLARARPEYRLVVVVEPLANSISAETSTPAFNLVLSHKFVAAMLSRKEDQSAIAVDTYFLHSLPGTVLPSQGRLAALVADAKSADELPTYELLE